LVWFLNFEHKDGKLIRIKALPSDSLKKIFEAHQKLVGLKKCKYSYYFEGYVLDADDTVGFVNKFNSKKNFLF